MIVETGYGPQTPATSYVNCEHVVLWKNGHTRAGLQRLKCAMCGKCFDNPGFRRTRMECIRLLAPAYRDGWSVMKTATTHRVSTNMVARYFKMFRANPVCTREVRPEGTTREDVIRREIDVAKQRIETLEGMLRGLRFMEAAA